MICAIAIAVVVAVGGLAALITALVLYFRFCHSPEKRWRDEVLGLLWAAEERARSEKHGLRQLRGDQDAESRRLREEALHAHLSNVAVSELEAYPGIGPATVSKLHEAGYVNLATLAHAQLRLHGLGEKRLADIHHAVRDLLHKAHNQFDRAACPPALALAKKLEQLSARYEQLEVRAGARSQAAEGVVGQLQSRAAFARRVTLWRWFGLFSKEDLVPAEEMEAELPDLNAILRAADTRAAQPQEVLAVPVPVGSRGEDGRPAPQVQRVAAANLVSVQSTSARAKSNRATPPGGSPPTTEKREPDMPDEAHLLLMELTIQFALAVARADGPVTPPERELLRQQVRGRFSYNPALLNRAEAFCVHYETAAIDLDRCLLQINQRFTLAHRTALIAFAGQIVTASGKPSATADPFLCSLAQRLGVQPVITTLEPQPPAHKPTTKPAAALSAGSARPVPAVTPSTPPPLTRDECLALLEIQPTAPLSADLVRRQWHLLSPRFASEKVASMGPEFVKMAEVKLASLRRAAEVLLHGMGERLEADAPQSPTQELRHNPDLDDVFAM